MSIVTLPITEVRNNFLDLVRSAKGVLERIIITKNGKPQAVLLSYDEYENWVETIEVAKDSALMKDIAKAKSDIKAGRVYSFADIKSALQKSSLKTNKKA